MAEDKKQDDSSATDAESSKTEKKPPKRPQRQGRTFGATGVEKQG